MLAFVLLSLIAADPPNVPFPPDETFELTIVDAAGNPIEGAEVDPWALRMGSGHGLWPEKQGGPKPVVKTDADGVARIDYPASSRLGPTSLISVQVRHPDYVAASKHLAVDPDAKAKLTLAGGTRLSIELPALDGDADLSTARVIISDRDVRAPQLQVVDGRLVTDPVSEKAAMVRVTVGEGDAMQFSDWTSWTPGDDAVAELTMILQAGLGVAGRLSDDVPRPVRRGWVVADLTAAGPTADHTWFRQIARPVEKDGTFRLEGIPHGCDVQVAVI